MPARSARRMNRLNHRPQNYRPPTEHLESRVLLTSATDAAIEQFNLSPALFVENDGQWSDSSVRFVHQGKGASIAMTDRGPVFELYNSGGTGVPPVIDPKDQMEDHGRDARATDPPEIESTRFAVSFNDANITQPIGHDQSSSTFNYNVGTPDLHRSNVHGFEKIVYPNLYEGIDLHTWGQRDSLKYEFHVDPNIDYRQIAVQYEGVEDLWIDDRGRLHAELGNGFGEVIDDSPVIWQEVKGKRVDVAGRFKLLDGDAYTFELTGKFDPKLPLVIDPDLAWGSYLGGTANDEASGIATDSSGNVYVSGSTRSSGWVSGGFDTSHNGNTDGFVVKMSASGAHVWSTYFGGSSNDHGSGIATDSSGNVYVTGETLSSGWVSGGFDTSYDDGSDSFVITLSATGVHLWSTYLGGLNEDWGYGIATDSSGNVYATGYTDSPGWVSDGFNTNYDGNGDVFVVKLSTTGAHLWSTYLGGFFSDAGYGIATDSSGNAYVTGATWSSGWVSGGLDGSFNGLNDAFVVKFSTSGDHVWSTYLGGSDADFGRRIAADSFGNVYVTGNTSSAGWVSGGFGTSYRGGDNDAFVVKLNTTGAHLWSTYIGGSYWDVGYGIAINSSGDVYVTGSTGTIPSWVSGGFDTSYNGGGDAFVAKLSTTGAHLWSTYLGGTNYDHGDGIATDAFGNVYVIGETRSADWVTGGIDTSYNGNTDGFVVKITDHVDVIIPIFENSAFNYLTTSQQTLTATFNENISASLAATDFVLTNLNTNATVPLTLQSISADGKSATFTFSATGNDLGGTILTDGHYRIRALAGQIEDAAGNALSQDVDHFFDFKNADFALDDHVVDFADLLVVAQNYGLQNATFSQGDANYDGEVDFADLLATAQRYGSGIPSLRLGQFAQITKTNSRTIARDVFGADSRIV